MNRAALYIRVSTLEQAQEGYSVGEQKERLIAYCKAKDWIIADIYVDGGNFQILKYAVREKAGV